MTAERGGESRAVLFLDIDGVLNCRETFKKPFRGPYGMIDRDKVALLNEVVAATGCQIVLSSAWRSDERFRPYFRRRGAKVSFHRDWRTGRNEDEPWLRGREIAEWLARNGSPHYAIVDDDSDMRKGRTRKTLHHALDTDPGATEMSPMPASDPAAQAGFTDANGETLMSASMTNGGHVSSSRYETLHACKQARSIALTGATIEENERSRRDAQAREEGRLGKWREDHPPRPPTSVADLELVDLHKRGITIRGATCLPYSSVGEDGLIYDWPGGETYGTFRLTENPGQIKTAICVAEIPELPVPEFR